MIIRVFYRGRDFFGHGEDRECYVDAVTSAAARAWTKKCMDGFKRDPFMAFRAETEKGEAFLLIEQSMQDAAAGVYTVTRRINAYNIETPVKMARAAVMRQIMELYAKEEAALGAA